MAAKSIIWVCLPDGSGFATASFPLPKDHWIYGAGDYEPPPMVFRCGAKEEIIVKPPHVDGLWVLKRDEMADKIRTAAKYAIRASTMKGREMDFDPDAMVKNLIVGLLGYRTDNGLSSDDWANPNS